MTGWIRVERKVFTDEFFAREPMSEREAWMWMIAKAAWEDTTHRVGGQVLPVSRGSFMVTLREMQSAFGWRSDTKVRNFLKRLEEERMAERTTCGPRNAPKTHVTICKYDEYQSPERTGNAPETHQKRTEKRSKETNINNKQDSSCAEFEEFWAIVPRKVAKGSARKAYARAIKKTDSKTIFSAMMAYAETRAGQDERFTAHPATWLNAERWADAPQQAQLKVINGGQYVQSLSNSDGPQNRADPAIEQIARLAGLGKAQGNGRR